jgi:hypothetical protein
MMIFGQVALLAFKSHFITGRTLRLGTVRAGVAQLVAPGPTGTALEVTSSTVVMMFNGNRRWVCGTPGVFTVALAA